jgi:hypothetical protein
MKSRWRFLKKLNTDLLYELAIPLSGICLKEHKSEYNRDTCTSMFIAALFTIAKLWNQPRYLSINEEIEKMWCTCIIHP